MLDTPRSVREVTDHIRDLFGSDPYLSDLWITGEVLESTVSRSGHVFFTLSSDGAQMRCVLFRMNALRQRSLPSPGAACVAHGRVEIYAADGSYQFYVDLVEDAGIGLAALELELLRQQLEAEGLFSKARKRPLPSSPAVIGVITSSAGAVWHDIQHVVRRRFPFVQLLMSPAAVQGDSAAPSIVDALHALTLDGRAELIIIARGGGSASDLAAFNNEELVRAVFAAPVPVVSAIGHETDWTLLDLVADVRAPTPSAAAELVTPPIASTLSSLVETLALHSTRFERELATLFLDINRLDGRLDRLGPSSQLPLLRSKLQDMMNSLATSNSQQSSSRHDRLAGSSERLLRSQAAVQQANEDRVSRALDLLKALSPAKTMERGYAFVEFADSGMPVTAAANTSSGQRLRTRFHDGSIESTVADVELTN